MQIPKEFLAPKNYEGTRLVEINDPRIEKLRAEIATYKPALEPLLNKLMEVSKKLDPKFQKIRDLQAKIDKIKEKYQPTKDEYDAILKDIEAIEQKTDAIKLKIQPIIASIMKDQLGEFEVARQLIEKDGKVYVEVADEIEEKVKAVRQAKGL